MHACEIKIGFFEIKIGITLLQVLEHKRAQDRIFQIFFFLFFLIKLVALHLIVIEKIILFVFY
jgi:hypothetical protein